MKSIQALIDDIEYQLKSKGTKYYDKVAIVCLTDDVIEINSEDITLPEDVSTKEKRIIIAEALRRIYQIVHQPFCTNSHQLKWQWENVTGTIITELPQKVWAKGSRHQIRRFMP